MQVDAGRGARSFRVLDGNGKEVSINEITPNGSYSTNRWKLEEGRSADHPNNRLAGDETLRWPRTRLRALHQALLAEVIRLGAARLTGGPRKIIKISEITGMEGDIISMQDIFVFRQSGLDEAGRAQGQFLATGIRPNLLEKLAGVGIRLPPSMFESRVLRPG